MLNFYYMYIVYLNDMGWQEKSSICFVKGLSNNVLLYLYTMYIHFYTVPLSYCLTDGRMDGWTDGRMDGWTMDDGPVLHIILIPHQC